MHELGGALADDLNTEHARRAALAEQRQESHRLAGDVRPRHFAEVGAAHDHVDFLRRGLALRQADAGDFRNRVHAARHQAGGGRRRQPERRERGAPALIGGRAGQRRRPDGIAGGENAGNIGLEALIHLHVAAAADGELQPVETDAVEVGDAAERREHDVGGQRPRRP